MPEPMPRPTRFFFSVDFFGARIVDKFIWIPCFKFQGFKVSRFQGFKVSRFQGKTDHREFLL